MVVHDSSWEHDASREEVWAVLHPQKQLAKQGADVEHPRVIEHGNVLIHVLCEGDENGDGLVRTCWFAVPKFLMSGGRAQSWELVSQVRPPEYQRYDAIGKPPWSRALGWYRLEDLGGNRTRVHFHEEYHVSNPIMKLLFEKYVHRFLSKDNDVNLKGIIEDGLKARRGSDAND